MHTTGPVAEGEVSGTTQQSGEPRGEPSPMHTTSKATSAKRRAAGLLPGPLIWPMKKEVATALCCDATRLAKLSTVFFLIPVSFASLRYPAPVFSVPPGFSPNPTPIQGRGILARTRACTELTLD
jgi:hypothetical protein